MTSIKERILTILESSIKIMDLGLDIYHSRSCSKQKLEKIRELAKKISEEAQELP